MPGVKSSNRLTSFMTAPALYRVVTSADGAVSPSSPPSISLINAEDSPRGLNELVLFVSPTGTCTLQVWAIVGASWYFVKEVTLTSTRPEAVVVKDLPACKWGVVVTVASAAVSITQMRSA